MIYKVLKALICSVLLFNLQAVQAEKLLQTNTSWEGGEIYYPQGKAEISSFKLTLKQGESTPFHCHPVPTMGYVIKGELQVETKNGKTTHMHQGESIVEVMKTIHKGTAVSEEAQIIVFYAGTPTVPNTVLSDNPEAEKYCN